MKRNAEEWKVESSSLTCRGITIDWIVAIVCSRRGLIHGTRMWRSLE